MSRLIASVLLLFVFASQLFAANHCGTVKFVQQRKLNPTFSKTIGQARQSSRPCNSSDYFDSVYTRKTEHFQIFYTLEGPHKTTEEYVDSLEVYAEDAWDFHTKKMDMKTPLGTATSLYYQQKVEKNLYPIEVVDIDLMSKLTHILGGGICNGCFGLTVPDFDNIEASVLLLDNDFKYTEYNGPKDTLNVGDKQCPYNIATEELENTFHHYSYVEHWDKALKVTMIHELYHAVQFRYLDIDHMTLWFEASASGIEEIAAPEIDDYYSYLANLFKKMGTSYNSLNEVYGVGIFFIYLYKHVDPKSDKFIWENFAKYPNQSFEKQFSDFATKKNLSAEALFHDFSTRLAFSGKKSSFVDSSYWITSDQKTWPEFKFFANETDDYFDPSIDEFTYKFYTSGEPNLENFRGTVSAVLFSGQDASIYKLKNSNSVSSILAVNNSVDSIAWIFSRFTGNSLAPTPATDSTLHAYPTPWRHGNLCFSPLPQNKKFIEIRNRRGDLIVREPYDGIVHCMDEEEVKHLMLPGVYHFRAGSSGKAKPFLIVY